MIILDSKEASTNPKLKKSLLRLDDDLKIESLGTGDVLVGKYLIERKTPKDLLTRVDGALHIFTQLDRLIEKRNEGLIPILLVEGSFSDAWKYRHPNKMHVIQAQIFGLLNSIQLFKYHIPIVKMDTHAQTIMWIKNLIKRTKDPSQKQLKILRTHPRRELSMDDKALYLIQGFKKIGPKRSKEILEEFGSVGLLIWSLTRDDKWAVDIATKDLEKVIGKSATKEIKDVLYHGYGEK